MTKTYYHLTMFILMYPFQYAFLCANNFEFIINKDIKVQPNNNTQEVWIGGLSVDQLFAPSASEFLLTESTAYAQKLIEDGLDPKTKDKDGNSLLDLAIYLSIKSGKHLKLVYLLYFEPDIDFKNGTISSQILSNFFTSFRSHIIINKKNGAGAKEFSVMIDEFTVICKQLLALGVDASVAIYDTKGRQFTVNEAVANATEILKKACSSLNISEEEIYSIKNIMDEELSSTCCCIPCFAC